MPYRHYDNLLDALLAIQPGEQRTVVAPPPQQLRVAAPSALTIGSALVQPVRFLARRVLRSPRAKQSVLALLARSPRLHAKAMAIMFAPEQEIALDPVPLDAGLAASLTERERLMERRAAFTAQDRPAPGPRPRLAFVSPLPPERTGIADYAAQLLPALMAHFDITLVVQQDSVTLPDALAALPVRDAAWLRAHAGDVDQIVYQIGNSEFHSHMFTLLRDLPGVVVLHDFFLGNVMAYRQVRRDPPGAWTGALFHSHGYAALRTWHAAPEPTALFKVYPGNLAVLEQASAIIHHSSHAAELARAWYGPEATRHWHSVPLPRATPPVRDRAAARAALGIADDVFLVCSFGYIMPNKLGDRLLAAWLASRLQNDPRCLLVLVGAAQDSPFGARVTKLVASARGRVRIAGWSDETVYHQYLQAADLGVQLRTSAQGETSAAVLDCMNYGIATIVNANGSMADLPADTVLRLPDAFADGDLVAAVESLYRDDAARTALGHRAAQLLASRYRPEHAAARYAAALRQPVTPPHPVRQLLVDIGDGALDDSNTLVALLAAKQIRVEAVRVCLVGGRWRVRYARTETAALLGLVWATPDDPLADLAPGDILYFPAMTATMRTAKDAGLWHTLREDGVLLALGWPDPAADLLVCRDAASAEAYNSGC